MQFETGKTYDDFALLEEIPVGAKVRITFNDAGVEWTATAEVVDEPITHYSMFSGDYISLPMGDDDTQFFKNDFVSLEILSLPEKTITVKLPDVEITGGGRIILGEDEDFTIGGMTLERSRGDRAGLFLTVGDDASTSLTREQTLQLAAVAAKVAHAEGAEDYK